MPFALRALLFWFLLLALAALNGALREFVLRPLSEKIALPLSGLTLAALLAIAIYFFVHWNAPLSQTQAWLIGLGWLVLTLGAETVLTLNAGRSVSDVFAKFAWWSIAAGNWVPLAYIVVTLAPPVYARVMRR